MTTVSTKSGRIIKVVSREEEKSTLTESDSEMDERAVEAVKAAINKPDVNRFRLATSQRRSFQAVARCTRKDNYRMDQYISEDAPTVFSADRKHGEYSLLSGRNPHRTEL